jgi:hypothetical protein
MSLVERVGNGIKKAKHVLHLDGYAALENVDWNKVNEILNKKPGEFDLELAKPENGLSPYQMQLIEGIYNKRRGS